MSYGFSIRNRRYVFNDLKELLAKATPFRSGDALAGLAAENNEERIAAQFALSNVPLIVTIGKLSIRFRILLLGNFATGY